MSKVTFKGREFELTNQVAEGKLQRSVINDGGLEFPFPNYDKAAEFLAGEYGGSVEEAKEALVAADPLEGVEVPGGVAKVEPEKGKGKGKGKGTGKGKGKAKEKEEKEPKEPKADKPKKAEPVEMTFELPGGAVTRTVQKKTILPDQKPLDTEDIKLSETVGLHIDRYSDKNRTALLYKFKDGDGAVAVEVTPGKNGANPHEVELITNYEAVKGEVLIEGVSLMDAIYKFGEVGGMTFSQADKYIKIKRGLLPQPEKKEKKDKKVTAEELKGKSEDAKAEEVKSEEVKEGNADLQAGAEAETK